MPVATMRAAAGIYESPYDLSIQDIWTSPAEKKRITRFYGLVGVVGVAMSVGVFLVLRAYGYSFGSIKER
jgi:hypothetical protein